MTYKEYSSDAIFSRGEATTNAAKMLAGIEALDDEVLEVVYSRAKAERRERNAIPVIQPGLVGVPVFGDMTPENIRKIKEVVEKFMKKVPDVNPTSVEVLEGGVFKVTYDQNGESVITTYRLND